MNDAINRKDTIGAILSIEHIAELSDGDAVIRVSAVNYVLRNLPSEDVQILSSLLAELTHKERTDRYHVWTTHEVKQWIADKITEMKNDG